MAKKGLVHIVTQSFSGVSSVSIDNCFSLTYSHYFIKSDFYGTDNPIRARLRSSSSDATGANYRRQYINSNGTTRTAGRLTGETTWGSVPRIMDVGMSNFAETWISNPFDSVRTTAWTDKSVDSDGNIQLESVVYTHDLSTSYDGISFILDGGTMTGSISIFGLVKS